MPSTLSKPIPPPSPKHIADNPYPYVFYETLKNQITSYNRGGKYTEVKVCRLMVPLDTYNKLMDLFQLSIGEDSRFSKAKIPNESQEFYDSAILNLLKSTIDWTFYSSRTNGKYYPISGIKSVSQEEVTVTIISNNGKLHIERAVRLGEIGHDCMEILRNKGAKKEYIRSIKHGIWYIKTWTPLIHHKFTQDVREEIDSVLSLLSTGENKLLLFPKCLFHRLPKEVLYIIFGLLPFAPFKELKE